MPANPPGPQLPPGKSTRLPHRMWWGFEVIGGVTVFGRSTFFFAFVNFRLHVAKTKVDRRDPRKLLLASNGVVFASWRSSPERKAMASQFRPAVVEPRRKRSSSEQRY